MKVSGEPSSKNFYFFLYKGVNKKFLNFILFFRVYLYLYEKIL